MSSTVAVDAARAEGRGEPTMAADAPTGAIHANPIEVVADCREPIVVPPWPRRRLHDALAELGPARPRSNVIAEPWVRVRDLDQVEEDAQRLPNSSGLAAPKGENGIAGAVPPGDLARGPSPVWCPPGEPATDPLVETFSPADPRRWGVLSLSDTDTAGNEIVRALAAFDHLAGPAEENHPPTAREPEPEAEERPPMIIERALAEQRMGILTVPAQQRPSPVPGLAVGFSLSMVAGAALYMFLAAG